MLPFVNNYLSKYPFLAKAKSLRTLTLIILLSDIFTMKGILAEVLVDNGLPYNSKEFTSCATQLGFVHTIYSLLPTAKWLQWVLHQNPKRCIDESHSSMYSIVWSPASSPINTPGAKPARILHIWPAETCPLQKLPLSINYKTIRDTLIDRQASQKFAYKCKPVSFLPCTNTEKYSIRQLIAHGSPLG